MTKSLHISFLIVLVTLQAAAASVFDRYEYGDFNFAKKTWGYETLDKEKFKKSGAKGDAVKSKMAAFIVKNQSYKGMPLEKVYRELGVANGYFISDISPTYVLQRPNKAVNEGWQLAFIPTKDGKNVKEVKIVKTCCD